MPVNFEILARISYFKRRLYACAFDLCIAGAVGYFKGADGFFLTLLFLWIGGFLLHVKNSLFAYLLFSFTEKESVRDRFYQYFKKAKFPYPDEGFNAEGYFEEVARTSRDRGVVVAASAVSGLIRGHRDISPMFSRITVGVALEEGLKKHLEEIKDRSLKPKSDADDFLFEEEGGRGSAR